jgi:hypothetical protein
MALEGVGVQSFRVQSLPVGRQVQSLEFCLTQCFSFGIHTNNSEPALAFNRYKKT